MRDQVLNIFKAIEFIETHLQYEITVAEIAESVGYSLFHFMRTFNHVVHHTPYDYLIRRRLAEAARMLISTKRRITDISQDFCFNNLESFSRAFRRLFDMQPSQWRDKKMEISTLLMPPLTFADLQYRNQDNFQFPVIEEINEIKLVGLMTALDADHRARQKQRYRCFADFCEIMGKNNLLQFVTVTASIAQNWKNVYYFIGIEKDSHTSEIPTLVVQSLLAGRYVKIKAADDERLFALNYIYFSWFPRSGLKPARQMEIEFCSRGNNGSVQEAIYIPLDLPQNQVHHIQEKLSLVDKTDLQYYPAPI